jgi:RNA polymerase sigma-70 factor (ECF subfamily)
MNDPAAFEQLMRRHNRALYRTARSIVKDDSEAEDVLQEAYILAFRGMQNFRGESSMATWLTRIVINEAIARTRRSSKAEIIQLDGEAVMDERNEQPEQALLRGEARRLIEQKIDGLPDAFRTVFVLRALEEMSVEETAACLDIPEATVRTRYFRARGLLREALSRELDIALEDAFAFDGARCDRIVANVLKRLQD